MAELLIAGGRVVTGSEVLDPGWIRVVDGTIAEVGAGAAPAGEHEVVDAKGRWVVPGFVDIHCHGGGGAAFTAADRESVERGVAAHRAHGTTTLLASLVSRPIPELAGQVRALTEFVSAGLIDGIHLEGPFLSAARCGAHDPAVLQDPDLDSVRTLLDAGAVRMVTIAPERDHAIDAVRLLVDRGVIAAVGHTDATFDQVMPAVEAGATVATHLFNGMRPLHHREPGPIGALLDDERITVELICDLVHLHPAVVRMATRHAGTGRTVLITDAIAAAAAGDGTYHIGNLEVHVKNGVPTLAGASGSLAGSTLTMDVAFRNLVRACGVDIVTAAHAAATRPAAVLGLADKTGAIAPGLAADLVLLDEDLRLEAVLRRGEWVKDALPG
ncbi:N-acetylglucosamine-6-phosphate deacetylase [Labedaea rhizosphaerae]|uniref:N-acetylglucosamine-6-phosphate deacetylase n=1 Tax=Labedaea rhizosphaerae TaxID=598644 RepID=A0A4R6SMV8_LABRH|nr:N-acetylglucosamine-6-phosphate deacetylase [Labedaea rhizosphaerae]TDQ05347.1 N-acetylglucosamine-6-phosphate deacetylase [Labedaea rhizosphaerae]